MQIFEVLEVREFPYFLTVEVTEGETVRDTLNDYNSHKVYLLVDHDTKKILTYNGPNSALKLQIFGGILANMLRKQLKLFYRIYPLNLYSKEDHEFQEILDKPLGEGRARSIEKSDFPDPAKTSTTGDLVIHNPRLKKVVETIKEYPLPENYKRIFVIIGGILYSEEDITELFLKEEKVKKEFVKMGRLNNGFTFFNDRNYSIRVIVKDRAIQGIELFTPDYEKYDSIELKVPVIPEEKFNRPGKIESLIQSFNIPEEIPEEKLDQGSSLDQSKNN
ncbi:MAG: hypothetical protein ACFE8M_12155 [Candidatus Hermodarchaeota archaeon]